MPVRCTKKWSKSKASPGSNMATTYSKSVLRVAACVERRPIRHRRDSQDIIAPKATAQAEVNFVDSHLQRGIDVTLGLVCHSGSGGARTQAALGVATFHQVDHVTYLDPSGPPLPVGSGRVAVAANV